MALNSPLAKRCVCFCRICKLHQNQSLSWMVLLFLLLKRQNFSGSFSTVTVKCLSISLVISLLKVKKYHYSMLPMNKGFADFCFKMDKMVHIRYDSNCTELEWEVYFSPPAKQCVRQSVINHSFHDLAHVVHNSNRPTATGICLLFARFQVMYDSRCMPTWWKLST